MSYKSYKTTRWVYGHQGTKTERSRLTSWGRRVAPRHLERQEEAGKHRRTPTLTDAMVMTSAPVVHHDDEDDDFRPGGVSTRPMTGEAAGMEMGKDSVNPGRASVESQSVVLKNRYDVRGQGSLQQHGRGGPGPPPTPSPVRPLGRVRLIRNQDPDDMSFTLPSLRPPGDLVDVNDQQQEEGSLVRQKRSRRRQGQQERRDEGRGQGGGQGKRQGQGQGQGQRQRSSAGSRARRAVSGGGSGVDRGQWSAGGGNPQTTRAARAKPNTGEHGGASTGHGPKTKTTTMFINKNQCMYIESSLTSGGRAGGGGGSGSGIASSVESSCSSGGTQGRYNRGKEGGGTTGSDHGPNKYGSLHLPRVNAYGTTHSLGPGNSPGLSSSVPGSSRGPRREHDFVKKLRLVNQRERPTTWRPETSTDNNNTRRSVNLPMRIRVHLPTSASVSGVSRERLVLEKTRRDIRDILRDGTELESNCCLYPTEPFHVASQAKLTPVLFSPALPHASGYYPPDSFDERGILLGNDCTLQEETEESGEPEVPTMLTQHSPQAMAPCTPPTGSASSPALISTHRVPLTSRSQSAHPGGHALIRATRGYAGGNGHAHSRPGSPGYASRPTSALSMRGMSRSRNSSISENPSSEQDGQGGRDGQDGRRAMWPSLIDVQRLKIGGFRYKNKPRQGGDPSPADLPTATDPPPAPSDDHTIEAKTKSIVNLGTIIVPSHTCVDCPLCNLYYAKEDLWPEGSHHPHGVRNVNNNNNSSNNARCAGLRRSKSARVCSKTVKSLQQENWSEVDLSKAAAQMNKEFSVPHAPRASPEPESPPPPPPDISEPEVVTPEVPKLTEVHKQGRRSGSAQALLVRRPRSANLVQSPVRNPFKDFRNEGVSVTVRIPASPRSDTKQKASYDQLMNSLKAPMTFKFSYVKVNPSDLLQAGKRQT